MHTALWVMVLLTASSEGSPSDEVVLALGRRLSADFWAGRLEPVWAQMNEQVHAGLGGSPLGLSNARDELLSRFGGPGETLGERVAEVRGVQVYLRTFRGKTEQPLLEQWTIQDGKTVAGFFIRHTELTVETAPERTQRPTARYWLAAGLLLGTTLSMAALSYWLRRRSKTVG